MIRRLLPLALLVVPALGHADQFSWIDWDVANSTSTSAIGTIATDQGPVTVTFSAPDTFLDATNFYNPASSFVGGIVGNAPTPSHSPRLVQAGSYSLTFSRPVANVALSLFSVGGLGTVVNYTFDQTPTVVAGGPTNSYGGVALTQNGNAVGGNEANGTVVFSSVASTLSWTLDRTESFSAIGVGARTAQPVPEPASLAALAVGGLALLRRRRR